MRLKKCALGCGGLVRGGGDRHGKGLCNVRSKSSRRDRRRQQRAMTDNLPPRGMPVAGIHKVSASSKSTTK